MTDFEDLLETSRARVAKRRADIEAFEAEQDLLRAARLLSFPKDPKLETVVPSPAQDQITVGQLKAMLAEYPDDMLVQTEGCDCYGPCDGVDLLGGGELLLTRGRG